MGNSIKHEARVCLDSDSATPLALFIHNLSVTEFEGMLQIWEAARTPVVCDMALFASLFGYVNFFCQ